MFTGVAKAADAAKVRRDSLGAATHISTHNPSRKNACEFLYEWKQYDGKDGRWNNEVVVPAFRRTLLDALEADRKSENLCDGRSLAVPNRRSEVRVADPFCITLKTFCLGYNK